MAPGVNLNNPQGPMGIFNHPRIQGYIFQLLEGPGAGGPKPIQTGFFECSSGGVTHLAMGGRVWRPRGARTPPTRTLIS